MLQNMSKETVESVFSSKFSNFVELITLNTKTT